MRRCQARGRMILSCRSSGFMTSPQIRRRPDMAGNSGFIRRTPHIMTQELCALLPRKTSYEFKPLYDLVYANLHARNAASGGDEMLRLRAYEKLQNLVHDGMVTKTAKKYRGR